MNMIENEIKRLIRKFFSSEIREELNNYYSEQTLWETLKQSRKEPSHTYFLSWFFDCPDFNSDLNNGAIKKLIILLLECAESQGLSSDDINELADSFYNQRLQIMSCKSSHEYHVNSQSQNSTVPSYGDGKTDIFITLTVKLDNNREKELRIIIENKIYSPETTKTTVNHQILYQTDGYYDYFNNESIASPGKYLNLFVFLKPISSKTNCHSKHYIYINYQQLLDQVIEPIYKRNDISENNKFKLHEYIRVLSKPSEIENYKNITIMATPTKEKQMLVNFFNENQDLIRAAIEAVGDDDLIAAIENIEKDPKDRTKYKIICKGKVIAERIVKRHLASKYIEAYAEITNANVATIRNVFDKICTGIISNTSQNGNKLYDCIVVAGKAVYIKNNVWGAGGQQFTNLLNKIDELESSSGIVVESEDLCKYTNSQIKIDDSISSRIAQSDPNSIEPKVPRIVDNIDEIQRPGQKIAKNKIAPNLLNNDPDSDMLFIAYDPDSDWKYSWDNRCSTKYPIYPGKVLSVISDDMNKNFGFFCEWSASDSQKTLDRIKYYLSIGLGIGKKQKVLFVEDGQGYFVCLGLATFDEIDANCHPYAYGVKPQCVWFFKAFNFNYFID